jgi:hypothetical protein
MVLLWLSGAAAGAGHAVPSAPAGSAPESVQQYFAPAEEAVQALLDAVRVEGGEGLLSIFGPEAERLQSGDAVADQASRERFLEAAEGGVHIELEGEDQAILDLGEDRWPFPIPIVKEQQGWRFDTAAGLEELLNRRIGRNELYTIAVMRAIVDAQHEYASTDGGTEGREYAQRFGSSEGKRDGLYWRADEGEEESPLGPLVAVAVEEGYRRPGGSGPQPYHGYYFRLLTAQGSHAPGGALSYLEDGRLTKGFGVLAYPAEYGSSGIMSFIASHRGILYQKDLGEETEQVAKAMTEYDPDRTWDPVDGP